VRKFAYIIPGRKIVEPLMIPSATRERLSAGIYIEWKL